MKKTVLFVDDDPAELGWLKALVENLEQDYEPRFASRGAEALALLAETPADIIVADMHMPGMTGAEFLNEVWKLYPKTVRFVVSTPEDKESIVKGVAGMHQFLTKPYDPRTLLTAIRNAKCLDDWLPNERLRGVVARMRTFPSIPSLYFEVLRALEKPDVSAQEVGEIIAKDLAMSTKLIQSVNSAFYGLNRMITDPAETVSYLGTDQVKSLVLCIHLFAHYDKVKPVYFSIDKVWKHSMAVATLARKLAQTETDDAQMADEAYTAGLLHDIGKLVLVSNLDDQYNGALKLANKRKIPHWEVEQEIFGGTHAEIGAYLLARWGLPRALLDATCSHHHPCGSDGKTFTPLTAVHVANVLEHERQPDAEISLLPQLDLAYLERLGLNERLDDWRALATGEPPVAQPKKATDDAVVLPAPFPEPPPVSLQPSKVSQFPTRVMWLALPALAACIAGAAIWWLWPGLGVPKEVRSEVPTAEAKPEVSTTEASPVSSAKAYVRATEAIKRIGTNHTASIQLAGTPQQTESRSTQATTAAPPARPLASEAAVAVSTPPAAVATNSYPTLKLQGIVFNQSRPSAMLNGQAVVSGEKVGQVKVVAITREAVTVEYLGEQRVLNLK